MTNKNDCQSGAQAERREALAPKHFAQALARIEELLNKGDNSAAVVYLINNAQNILQLAKVAAEMRDDLEHVDRWYPSTEAYDALMKKGE